MNQKSDNMKKLALSSLSLVALGGISHAATVLIDETTRNGGFESPALTTKAYLGFDGSSDPVTQDIDYWQNAGHTTVGTPAGYTDTGVEPPGGNSHTGEQFAFLRGIDGGAFNLTVHVIQEGDVFDLSWWGRSDGLEVRLFSSTDGTYGTAATLDSLNHTSPGDGSWGQFSFNYTATASDAGKTVGVSIFNNDESGWANIDDVVLTVTPVPEPSSILLGGIGLLGLLRRRR